MKKQAKSINDLKGNAKVLLVNKTSQKNLKGGLGDPPPFGIDHGRNRN